MRTFALVVVLALGSFVGSFLGSPLAHAQGSPQKQLEDACRIAVEDLDLGDAVGAELRVAEALAKHGRGPLAKSTITARAHAVLGAALLEQGQKDKAQKEFAAAVAIDAKVALPPKLDRGAAKEAMAAARKPVQAAELPPPVSMDPDSPVMGIVHIQTEQIKEGAALPVEVKVGAEVKAKAVVLHYRAVVGKNPAKQWLTAPMSNTKGLLWKADVPATATAADQLQYYVDATNAKSKRVAARGSVAAPYVVAVLRTPKPTVTEKKGDEENPLHMLKDGDTDENPLEAPKKKK